MIYKDFEAWIRPGSVPHTFSVSVTNSPVGPKSGEMRLDVSDPATEQLLLQIISASESLEAREQFGKLLFSALFGGPIRDAWTESVGRAQAIAGQGLRLRLWIDDPAIATLPWELLHDGNDFLAVSQNVVVSRFLPAGEPPPMITPRKARVLLLIQEPEDKPILKDVSDAVQSVLQNSARFDVPKVLKNASLAEIDNELLNGYDVLHYIGHGGADKLLLASDKEVVIKDGREFATLFTGQPSLQLVVLNVCGSGATTSRGIFSGLGPVLAQKRLPAVIAMQYAQVSQLVAAQFNEHFYTALEKSVPVDVAVNTARRRLFLQDASGRDWSTPVLYMTSRTGRILEFVDDPAQATARAADVAREQAQREVTNRELIVSLNRIADALATIDRYNEMLSAARIIQSSLDQLASPINQGRWDSVRKAGLPQLKLKIDANGEVQQAAWVPNLLSSEKETTENLKNNNAGFAEDSFRSFESAVADGIAWLEDGLKTQNQASRETARLALQTLSAT
jgi:CHAT domain